MPRPVVPILAPGALAAASRATSSAGWIGRIRQALSAMVRMSGLMATPWASIFSISPTRCQGSTTTPLPMIDGLPCTTPLGSRASL